MVSPKKRSSKLIKKKSLTPKEKARRLETVNNLTENSENSEARRPSGSDDSPELPKRKKSLTERIICYCGNCWKCDFFI